MKSKMMYLLCTCFFFILLIIKPASWAGEDSFLQGYITAVLEREFHISSESFTVRGGAVTLRLDMIPESDRIKVINTLLAISGVQTVKTGDDSWDGGEGIYRTDSGTGSRIEAARMSDEKGTQSIQGNTDTGRPFEPLIADPLWPHFSVSYQYFTDDGGLDRVVAATIGETVPLYRDYSPLLGDWQVSVQAAAYTINDLDTSSWDLVNSDFRFGLALTNRTGPVSGLFRVYHFSSHAGDEYLINNDVKRVNISNESIDAVLSFDLKDWLRVYGGTAYRFGRHPKEFDPWSLQYGVEFRGQDKYRDIFRPVAGVNFYHLEERDWATSISARAGFELESHTKFMNRIQFLIGYFNGPSPYGQFYQNYHEFIEFGMHLHM